MRDSVMMVFVRRLAITAACNSNWGIVSSFSGATRDLAATNLTPNLLLNNFHLTYAHVPNASRDASQNTTKVGLIGYFTWLRAAISWRSFYHFRCLSGGMSSSHPTPSCQSSCMASFDLTRTAVVTPIGSNIPVI